MAGPGPQGYPDYQKVENWDGPLLYERETVATGELLTGFLPTSRYAGISCSLQANNAGALVTVESAADSAGVKVLGTRKFVIDPTMGAASPLLIPCVAPWTQLKFTPLEPTTKWLPKVLIFGSNRQQALMFLPSQPLLLNVTHVFAASGSFALAPTGYYAGPVGVLLQNTAATAGSVEIQAETALGVFATTQKMVLAGIGETDGIMVAPMGAWQVVLRSAGATTVVVAMTPSMTGAA